MLSIKVSESDPEKVKYILETNFQIDNVASGGNAGQQIQELRLLRIDDPSLAGR
jgi:hypothetical protein